MFEVGKKYRYNNSGYVYTCLAIFENKGWFQYYQGALSFTESHIWSGNWREYKEPVAHTEYLHVRKDGVTTRLYCVAASSEGRRDWNVGSIALTMTDGKLTKVEIVE